MNATLKQTLSQNSSLGFVQGVLMDAHDFLITLFDHLSRDFVGEHSRHFYVMSQTVLLKATDRAALKGIESVIALHYCTATSRDAPMKQ